MMPTAVIHIGTEKTGSTTIQEFLAENRKQLGNAGLFIPSFLGRTNHRLLPFLAYSESREDEFTIRYSLAPGSRKRTHIRNRVLRDIRYTVRTQRAVKWIISSEHIHSRLTTERELIALKEILDEYFNSYSFLLYAREPIDLAVSLLSTAIRDGHYLEDLPSPTHPYWHYICNYKKTISMWQKIFGKNRVAIRLYDRSLFKGGSLITDFCEAVGIELGKLMVIPKPKNTSLSIDALRLLNRINRIRDLKDNKSIYMRSSHSKSIASAFDAAFPYRGDGFVPTYSQICEYGKEFEESNIWVISRFPHLPSDYWNRQADKKARQKEDTCLAVTDSEDRFLRIINALTEPKSELSRLDMVRRLYRYIRGGLASRVAGHEEWLD